jgi:hypothetical protein
MMTLSIDFNTGLGIMAALVGVVTFLTAVYVIIAGTKYFFFEKNIKELQNRIKELERENKFIEKTIDLNANRVNVTNSEAHCNTIKDIKDNWYLLENKE